MSLPVPGRLPFHTAGGLIYSNTYDINLSLLSDIDFYNHPVYSGDLPPAIAVTELAEVMY
jgi:hypothetical protein